MFVVRVYVLLFVGIELKKSLNAAEKDENVIYLHLVDERPKNGLVSCVFGQILYSWLEKIFETTNDSYLT